MASSMGWTELPSCILVHAVFTLSLAYEDEGFGLRAGWGMALGSV
jgi:hypothetical protein